MNKTSLDSEDILSDSLDMLYDHRPITFSAAGTPFAFMVDKCPIQHNHIPACMHSVVISLQTPDTYAAHWALHASSIWVASIYLANHLQELHLEDHLINSTPQSEKIQLLELGASAGLPSITIAKLFGDRLRDAARRIFITTTDYPDDRLIRTLADNVAANGVATLCRVVPYAWGSDVSPLLWRGAEGGFDVIIAADTIWNPDLHEILIDSLKNTLKKSPTSRVHLVVGLHTGRYTIQSFLDKVILAGFELDGLCERESIGSGERKWEVSRNGEDEKERRKWIVWIQLKWNREALKVQI
ncbi:putative methyltransferase-domain-containing protein [Crepidotus variabilis]|uniref:Methyltransferase-domain-containing protein n=1 Tax=Crepidotus variabilis TaxID=179855 RepID=A0A9P6EKW4_9AGAR|nr:putative methyltransferase-domain-containing protein [Crepidotus variabilis]